MLILGLCLQQDKNFKRYSIELQQILIFIMHMKVSKHCNPNLQKQKLESMNINPSPFSFPLITLSLATLKPSQLLPRIEVWVQCLQRMVAIKLQPNLNYFIQQITSICIIVLLSLRFYQTTHHRMSTTQLLNNPSKRTLDFRQKYKTEKCRYWYQTGFCPFFQFCAFAHAEFELRDRHAINQNYKTKICSNFKNSGFCRYGERCQFLHVRQVSLTGASPPAQMEHFPALSWDKQSVSTIEEVDSKHQNDLKLLTQFGLDILSTKKGNRSTRWRQLLEEREAMEKRSERKEWSEGLPQSRDFEQMFPQYNFLKKPRLASI